LAAWLAAPFTVLPHVAAELLATLVAALCVAAVLLLLKVKDWRCYAIAFVWLPVYSALQTANVMLLVAVCAAAVWRWRDRPLLTAAAAGFAIALKVVAWPLVLWLAVRRRGTALAAALFAAGLVLIPWLPIGLADLTGYPHLLRVLSQVEWRGEYTIAAALSGFLPGTVALVVGNVAGFAVLAAAVWITRSDEQRGFLLVVGSLLLLSPIAHLDYFVLLLLPLGVARPRFDWAWCLPLLLWVAPQAGNGATWQTVTALAVTAATFAVAAAPPVWRPRLLATT
jgi:hypothetical protein